MKNFLIILLFLLFTSFTQHGDNVKDFHIRAVGSEEVEKFEAKFPQIVNNKYVYVAYLGKYYRGHENEYCLMLER